MKITHKTSKYSEGFTIIETMIVLAIAALIMLIVFLAVPALQRAQRNTATKNDASRIAAAVSTFVSNANGELPCQTTPGKSFDTLSTDPQTVLTDTGKLGQITVNNSQCIVSASASSLFSANTFNITNDPIVPKTDFSGTYTADELVLFEGATCSGNTATSNPNPRSAALVYTIEVSNSLYGTSCIQAL